MLIDALHQPRLFIVKTVFYRLLDHLLIVLLHTAKQVSD